MACCCTTSLSVFRLDILFSSGYGVSRTLGGGRTFLVTLRDGAGVAILPDAVGGQVNVQRPESIGVSGVKEAAVCRYDRSGSKPWWQILAILLAEMRLLPASTLSERYHLQSLS